MIGIKYKGRFGNNMFQYTFGRLLAIKHGYDFMVMDKRKHDDMCENWFEIDRGVKFDKNYSFTNTMNEKKLGFLHENYSDFSNVKKDTIVNGFWQSEKYFIDNEKLVEQFFQKKTKIYINETKHIKFNENLCIIHMRVGDYIKKRKSWILPKDFYIKAMNKMLTFNKNIKFKIVTDTITYAKEQFPNIDIVASSPQADFHRIMQAKYKIISNSSFSWWSAWLGHDTSKITIAPNYWINYGRWDNQVCDPKNLKGKLGDLCWKPSNIKSVRFLYI